MLRKQITSSNFDRRLVQVIGFGGSPVVFTCFTILSWKLAADAGEMVIGIVAAAALAIGMVNLGIVGAHSLASQP